MLYSIVNIWYMERIRIFEIINQGHISLRCRNTKAINSDVYDENLLITFTLSYDDSFMMETSFTDSPVARKVICFLHFVAISSH